MKKVTKYETSDGSIFDTEEQAVYYESFKDIQKWYLQNEICHYGTEIGWTNFIEWFIENKTKMKELVEAVDHLEERYSKLKSVDLE